MTIGVMVCGHGSRDVAAVAEFHRLVRKLGARLPEHPLEGGFLEFARPIISEGLDRLRERGVDHVLAVPGMLFAAGHVKNDVPSVLNAYAAEHGMRVDFGCDLGIDPKLLRAARDRIEMALASAAGSAPHEATLLAVIALIEAANDSRASGEFVDVG